MTKVSFAKKVALRLLLAGSMLFISFPIVNASGASAPCLAQFADSAWLQGQPQQVTDLLNNNLVLTQVQVVPSSNFDFGGVIPVVVFQGNSVRFGSSLPSSPKVLLQEKLMNWYWTWTQAKNYLTHTYEFSQVGYKPQMKPFQYYDVRIGAVARKAPITVSFDYKGEDCADRTVSVASYLDIVPVQSLNMSSATDDQINDFLKRFNSGNTDFLNIRNQLSRVRNIEAWFKYTKKEPIPIIFPKGVSAKTTASISIKYAWETHPGVSSLLWLQPNTDFNKFDYVDSNDGCLTNKNRDKYIKIIESEQPYFSTKKNVCRVFLHILSTDLSGQDADHFAPEQIVIEGWVTKAKILSKSERYLPSIFCSNGTVFKVITAKNPVCPTGLKIISK